MDGSVGGQSLLDVILSRTTREKVFNSRVMYLGTKKKKKEKKKEKMQKKSKLALFHEQLFSTVDHELSDFPYGLLYESSDHCIHILEGKMENILSFLQNLNKAMKKEDSELTNVSILYYSDDIGNKMFPRWGYQNVSGFMDEDEEEYILKTKKDWMTLIYHTEHKLLNIGKRILHLRPQEMEHQLFSYLNQAPHLIPSPFSMKELAKCEYCLSLEEFCEVYCSPVDLTLDDELIWPTKESLISYNQLKNEKEKSGEKKLIKPIKTTKIT